MLQSIDLQFSETGQLTLPARGTTIFVGPNNSGKSLVLREIEQAFNVHPFPDLTRILTDYEIEWPTSESIGGTIEKMQHFRPRDLPAHSIMLGRLNLSGHPETMQMRVTDLLRVVKDKQDKQWLATQYLKWGVIRLDGRSRFNLTNDQPGHDLTGAAQNILMHLFKDDAARKKVRLLVKDAFRLNFVVDPTNLGHLRIRLSENEPLDDEQSLNAVARKFHADALYIKDASDGVQAFTGIVSAVCSGEFHTILVDEPEAFLHPPLARKLGKSLAGLASERGGTLMASTHSADFLMGCVQASPTVRVVRLEYNDGKSRARVIDPEVLESFFRRPLMRSANVISGLFHDGVVICESDNDRAFYGEIYHRLAVKNPDYPSVLFINAQNKQTIKDMMGPLRKFGVPAVAIPDIDIVKDGGAVWTDWLSSAQIPDALRLGYGQQRSAIKEALVATGKDMKSDGGIDVLSAGDKAAAEHFFANLDDYGIFTVRSGELESWMPELKVPGKKTDWTVSILERLGSDPGDAKYVHPAEGGVWNFLERVVAWIRNPARKGMT